MGLNLTRQHVVTAFEDGGIANVSGLAGRGGATMGWVWRLIYF